MELEVRSSSESGSGFKEIDNSLLKVRISKNMPECEVGTDLIISVQVNWWNILQLWMQLLQCNHVMVYITVVQFVLIQHMITGVRHWCNYLL